MNRAQRRQRELRQQKYAATAAKVVARQKPVRRSHAEFFAIAALNMVFGVFGLAVAPFLAHLVVAEAIKEQSPSYLQDIYLCAMVLWGNSFYEIRCNQDDADLGGALMRVYSALMHWFSPIMAVAMAVAYAFLVAEKTSAVSAELANPLLLGVLLGVAALAYLGFKLPVLWAIATRDSQKE